MPTDITLTEIPAGYSLSAGRSGQTVEVATCEFLSSEDGDAFIRRLDGFPTIILGKLPPANRLNPSQVDHLLAIIRKDNTATVYVNELSVIAEVLVKRACKVGQPVFGDDIADIRKIMFKGIEIPTDTGVLYLFSSGWRKALFYDFGPIRFNADQPRTYDIGVVMGQFYAYLLFQDLLKIPEAAWIVLLEQGWFPFISLPLALTKEMANFAENSWRVDELLPKVSAEVEKCFERWQLKWSKSLFFKDHLVVLKTAVDRYSNKDYVSAVSILYPRIEGVMRSFHLFNSPSVRQSQSHLVDTAVPLPELSKRSKMLLLPEKFRHYLTHIYFKEFDPKKPEGVSRHTVAHGVAPEDTLSQKAAVIGFLILDQLSYYFSE